jgi:hypothetical protein
MPDFAKLAAKLHDMTKKTFKWDPSTWTVDYSAIFEEFKRQLLESTALFYPDYSLEWVLRVDASELGVGFVLFQIWVRSSPDDIVHQPILFGSQKFSDQALHWDTYNKEAYAMYYSVKLCEYYLRAKPFRLEGDHRNLIWIEASSVPKVIRWRIYLQGFAFTFINHISGRENIVADWQSRLFNMSEDSASGSGPEDASHSADESTAISQYEMLRRVHGKRSAHFGARRTWLLLNKHFPGHKIPYAAAVEYVLMCGICQKVRLGMNDALVPSVRTLKNPGPRRVVGIDFLTLVKDDFGSIGVYVIRDHHTKLVAIYPVSANNAENAALSIFTYCVTYAAFEVLISDPGSDFMSETIEILNEWFGIHHRVSLVDRHESNGVEGANKQILRHLKTLLCDERINKRWSVPSVIGWVSFIMNSFDDSESGLSPYVLTFGSDVSRYLNFPASGIKSDTAPEFVKQLDADLAAVRAVALEYQQSLVEKRVDKTFVQNMYQPGDLVLLHLPTSRP